MADQPSRATDVRLDGTDAMELMQMLTFLADWFDSRDKPMLNASLKRFAHKVSEIADLQADLARFAFLLGDDGERLLDP